MKNTFKIALVAVAMTAMVSCTPSKTAETTDVDTTKVEVVAPDTTVTPVDTTGTPADTTKH